MSGSLELTAERECALTDGTDTPRATWRDAATGLVDAITGIWLAPWTPPGAVRPAAPARTLPPPGGAPH